jgi:hypothetical protein
MFGNFEKLCTPAKLYFAIAIISIIIGLFSGFHFFIVLGKLIFTFIYTFILNWLCSKGLKSLSWFLVLLPYVILFLVIIGILRLSKEQNAMVQQNALLVGQQQGQQQQ